MPRPVRLLALVVLPAALAGCAGSGSSGGGTVDGDTLRIYSSQPLSGRLAGEAQAIVSRQRLALADAGGRVGKRRVELIALDDADRETGTWDPGLVSANARKAAQDDKTIAYLGEMGTGASAVSIPILNETGILEVSPTDTVAGFTKGKGATPASRTSTTRRATATSPASCPPDDVQAAALLALLQDDARPPRRGWPRTASSTGSPWLASSCARPRQGRRRGQGAVREPGRRRCEEGRLGRGRFGRGRVCLRGRVAPPTRRRSSRRSRRRHRASSCTARTPSPTRASPRSWAWRAPGPSSPRRSCRCATTRPPRRPWPSATGTATGRRCPSRRSTAYETMSSTLAAMNRAGKKANDRGKVIDQMLETRRRNSVLGTLFDRRGRRHQHQGLRELPGPGRPPGLRSRARSARRLSRRVVP